VELVDWQKNTSNKLALIDEQVDVVCRFSRVAHFHNYRGGGANAYENPGN